MGFLIGKKLAGWIILTQRICDAALKFYKTTLIMMFLTEVS